LRPEEPVTHTTRLPVLCCALLGLAASASPAAAANTAGNPYSFYGSVAECAAAQRDRCAACSATGACTAITDLGDGRGECARLTASGGRGEYLICINLALAIDAVASCAARSAPSCSRDTAASESIAKLEANAEFLDAAACAAPLDACLASLYGAPGPGFPGPGSGGAGSPRPRHTSISCDDSWRDNPNCDDVPDCELDVTSCDAPYDGTCSDSSEQSGCSDSEADGDGGDCSGGDGAGGDAGGDSCSSDSGGDGGDCSSSGDGGDCSGGDGGDCSGGGGGGDCSGGGGGDCSGGGGGDCGGGGGGDCNVAGGRGRTGVGLPVAIAWALLPLPFATIVRRRAERRRARAEYDAEGGAP
jgi:hypothetical protein